MANADRPNGFKPVKHLSGAPYNGQANKYMISASDSTAAVGVGDFVVLSDQAGTDGLAAVESITAGAVTAAVLVGSVVAVLPFNDDGSMQAGQISSLDTPVYRADDTKRFVLVADAPDLVFEAQEDSDGGNIALASVGLNCGFLAASPSSTTGTSAQEIDSSSVQTTNSLPLQILGVVQRPDNEVPAANGRFHVRINTHAYHGTVTAV